MALPTLNLQSLSLERRSAADGQLGSVSPRPTHRSGRSPFDDEVPVDASAGRYRGRSPSQPMLSLLEHEEQRSNHERQKQNNASVPPGRARERMSVVDVLVEGTTAEPDAVASTRHNPTRAVTSLAVSDHGTFLAAGDKAGRVWIVTRKSDAMHFSPWVGKRCYSQVIDPLNSVEVSPVVSKLAFLPQIGPTLHLLTTNEKVPKLYKIMEVRQTPPVPRSVNLIGTKIIGPLTSPQKHQTVAMKQVHHFAMDHEYMIHSICPTSDGTQFYTADDVAVRLWCTEYPQTSIETYTLKRASLEGGNDVKELIRNAAIFPSEPSLLFMSTTAGCVRVVDTREGMRWCERDTLTFSAPARSVADGPFAEVTNAFSSSALSPCGRYLCARDFMSVPVWDIRRGSSANGDESLSPTSKATPGGPIARYEVNAHLRPQLDVLYQTDLLLEKYDVKFLSPNIIATGTFCNTMCVVDLRDPLPPVASEVVSSGFNVPGVHKYRLPTTARATRDERQELISLDADTDEQYADGSRVMTLATATSSRGTEVFAGCGECVVQVSA